MTGRPRPPARPAKAAAPGDAWQRTVALATVTSTTGALVVDTIGVASLPRPVDAFVRQHALLLLLALVALSLAVLVWQTRATRTKRGSESSHQGRATTEGRLRSRLLLALSALSGISTLTAASLAVLIAVHSPLLPNTYTPTFAGPHDENLEVALTAVEASDYLIGGDPAAYSLAHLPPASGTSATAVVRPVAGAGGATDRSPYGIVLSARNLRPTGPGMFIESVSLRVAAVDQAPQPLQVWSRPAPLHYAVNPFTARYRGQAAGGSIVASYAGAVPLGHIQLGPQESDELTIDVSSAVNALVRFRVEVAYRLSDQLQERRLAVPLTFGAVFSEEVFWVRYTLDNGRLVPG